MSDFDWVTERANCSIDVVFESLKTGVRRDVDTRDGIAETEGRQFKLIDEGDNFSVVSIWASGRGVIRFVLKKPLITVSGDGQPLMEARLMINDEGRCRLRVKDDELEFWQFRRRALERLFFDF